MEQLEKFKTIIYQIIGDNKFILSALELIRDRGDLLPSIEMSDMSSSAFIPDTNTIQVSIPDIIECYDLSKGCKINLTFRFFFNSQYLNYNVRSEKCFGISINMPLTKDESNHVEEMLYGSDFLQNEKTTQNDVVAIYSLAYSLFHEIGHALHDKYIAESKPLNRERSADAFAFEAVKSMCDIENINILLLGVFIGIIQVLDKRTPQKEIDDTKHPHSIERLYALLDFWNITDDSPYWRYSFDVVYRWCTKNHLSMAWIKDKSTTYKDKFTDAYLHYRKSLQ